MELGLGRLEPPDWEHVEKYPLTAVMEPRTITVEKIMPVPSSPTSRLSYRLKYNQRQAGACVGFSWSMYQSIRNRRFYDPWWLWKESQLINYWREKDDLTLLSWGTSVRTAASILQARGHCWARFDTINTVFHIDSSGRGEAYFTGTIGPPDPQQGIAVYRWARTVDEIRTCIANNEPVVVGTNWWSAFDNPVRKADGSHWIGEGTSWGNLRGGHAYVLNAASDSRQAFRTPNSWGTYWPQSWIPYSTMERLLNEGGEACIATDR